MHDDRPAFDRPHLNPNLRGLSPSATVATQERCNRLLGEGRKIYKMGLGQSPFPVPESVVAALRDNAFQKDYLPVKGLFELRDTLARRHTRLFGIECNADRVLIGPGSKELMFLLQLVFGGDVLIPSPAWVSYEPQARIIGRRVVNISTAAADNWQLTPDQLEAVCRQDPARPRLLILNYPANPTGASYSKDALAGLAAVCRKYGVIVLSDEIYSLLRFEGEHHSLLPLYPEGTIYSSGLSKWCGAGGWRLGTFIFPKELTWIEEAMAVVASETFTSTSAPIQYAAIQAFEGGPEIERYVDDCTRILKALAEYTHEKLQSSGLPTVKPEGGFYCFPDFAALREPLKARGISHARQMTEAILEETGVAILPGVEFGRPASELTARIAFVDFDGGKALAAQREEANGAKDPAFIRTHCARTVEAVDRIAEWVKQL
ncbi:MAG: pyridoxal phosphate-dependent aminotransferase [Halioglobus sp.]|nr:pyridoxal phosphate-dependent aminotransferase [Halioglobus sp.]